MKEVLSDKLDNFSNALKRLEEAFAEEGYSLCVDGTIKRFEFTFEMAWKALKKFLLYEGIECVSVRDCVKKAYQARFIKEEVIISLCNFLYLEAYQARFIKEEEVWLNMLKDRNTLSHIYDEKEAMEIYQRIRDVYFTEFKKLKEKLIEKMNAAE